MPPFKDDDDDDELKKYAEPAPDDLAKYEEKAAAAAPPPRAGFFRAEAETSPIPHPRSLKEAQEIYRSSWNPLPGAKEVGMHWGEGAREVGEAAQNIRDILHTRNQGTGLSTISPILSNLGKAAYGVYHGAVEGAPFIGAPIESLSRYIREKNYPAAAGSLTGIAEQLALAKAFEERAPKGRIPKETAPTVPPETPPRPPAPELPPRPGPPPPFVGEPIGPRPETLPRTPSADAELNATAHSMGWGDYDKLDHEHQLVVARNTGTRAPEGVERRVVQGAAPTIEQRAGQMPLPRVAPQAVTGAPSYTLSAPDEYGMRWAQSTDPAVPPISISAKMSEADIPAYVAQKQALQRTGVPKAQERLATPGTLPTTPEAKPAVAAPQAQPEATTPATIDEVLRKMTGQPEPQRARPGEPLRPLPGQPSATERPPPIAAEAAHLKEKYPDDKTRYFVHANGEGVVDAAKGDHAVLQPIHDLKNWEVRQAAINFGIDVGTKHVGSRLALGGEQITRQALLDEMIRRGAKPEDIPRLAQPPGKLWQWMRHMKLPANLADSFMVVLHHELGHGIINGLRDLFPQRGIVSHHHPQLSSGGPYANAAAGLMTDEAAFRGANGKYIPEKVVDNLEALLDVAAGGVAANEVVDGIPRHLNPGMGGDLRGADELMNAANVPPDQRWRLWNEAVERNVQDLRPVADIIREEAGRREENLALTLHASEGRVNEIVERAKREGIGQRKLEATGQQSLFGDRGANAAQRGGSAAPSAAGAAGEGAAATAKAPPLKPFRPGKIEFRVLIDEGQGLRPVTIEVTDYKKAQQELLKKYPNTQSFQVLGAVQPVPHPFMRKTASSVRLMEDPLNVKGTGPRGNITTLDVAKALNRFTRSMVGALSLAKAEPAAMVARAKAALLEEVKYQMAQKDSGSDFYKVDIAKHDAIVGQMRPSLKDPVKLSIFKMAEAIMSLSAEPYPNVGKAIQNWDHYEQTGKFSPTNLNYREAKPWGPGSISGWGDAFNSLNELIEKHGEKGASEWLLADHPVSELRMYNDGVAGEADEMQPGTMIFGDKRGPFALNLHGMEAAFTIDRWVSRTWNRWMGTLEWDEEGKLKTDTGTRNDKERALMTKSFSEVAEDLGLTTASLQAVMWYYEQALYTAQGIAKRTGTFSGAAARLMMEEKATGARGAPARSAGRTSSAPSRRR
jgi:hypothetical protein